MESRVRVIKQVVRESLYEIDERAVADAIVLRALVKLTIAAQPFQSEHRGPSPRSFRRDPDARSFRLSGAPRLRRVSHS
jgi:hypothetical protein